MWIFQIYVWEKNSSLFHFHQNGQTCILCIMSIINYYSTSCPGHPPRTNYSCNSVIRNEQRAERNNVVNYSKLFVCNKICTREKFKLIKSNSLHEEIQLSEYWIKQYVGMLCHMIIVAFVCLLYELGVLFELHCTMRILSSPNPYGLFVLRRILKNP